MGRIVLSGRTSPPHTRSRAEHDSGVTSGNLADRRARSRDRQGGERSRKRGTESVRGQATTAAAAARGGGGSRSSNRKRDTESARDQATTGAAAQGGGGGSSGRRDAEGSRGHAATAAAGGDGSLVLPPRSLPLLVRVKAVFRFTIDGHFTNVFGQGTVRSGFWDGFDVVVHTGRCMRKCLLSPALNRLVYLNQLKAGVVLKIHRMQQWFNELSLPADPIPVVLEADVLPDDTSVPATSERLVWDASATAHEQLDRPLYTPRGCYCHVLCNDALWCPNAHTPATLACPDDVLETCFSWLPVSDFLQAVTGKRRRDRDLPPVFGRIVKKSRIFNFAKVTDANQPYPFNFSLEIADSKATLKVTLWNSCAMAYHGALSVGAIVVIKQYGCRFRSTYTTADFELSLNPSHPRGEVFIIPEEEVSPEKFPALRLNTVVLSRIPSIPEDTVVDVSAIIAMCGRVERHICERTGIFLYRWVWLVDGVDGRVVPAKLYANSRPDALCALQPGQPVVLTCMRVHLVQKNAAYPYLTTTADSAVLLQFSDEVPAPPPLPRALSARAGEQHVLLAAVHCNTVFMGALCAMLTDNLADSSIPVCLFKDLPSRISSLAHLEAQTFLFQAMLDRIECGPGSRRRRRTDTPEKHFEVFFELQDVNNASTRARHRAVLPLFPTSLLDAPADVVMSSVQRLAPLLSWDSQDRAALTQAVADDLASPGAPFKAVAAVLHTRLSGARHVFVMEAYRHDQETFPIIACIK